MANSVLVGGIFSLAGVLVTVTIGMGTLIVKHRWDRDEVQRAMEHERQRIIWEKSYSLNVDFLGNCQSTYLQILAARKARRPSALGEVDELIEEAYRAALKQIPGIEGQSSLDGLRLIAPNYEIIEAAESLWMHLRSCEVAIGNAKDGVSWASWKSRYWSLRQNFIMTVRISMGTAGP